MNKTLKIVLSGAESSGKSTLAKQLSEYYQVPYIAEVAREYVNTLTKHYTYEDVEEIARQQVSAEKEILAKNPPMVFIDLDLTNTKYWFLDVYNTIPDWIEEEIKNNKPDLHLLCYYDLPWEADPTRENPNRREHFYNLYKNEIETLGIPYGIVTGSGEERLKNAIRIIEKTFDLSTLKNYNYATND